MGVDSLLPTVRMAGYLGVAEYTCTCNPPEITRPQVVGTVHDSRFPLRSKNYALHLLLGVTYIFSGGVQVKVIIISALTSFLLKIRLLKSYSRNPSLILAYMISKSIMGSDCVDSVVN